MLFVSTTRNLSLLVPAASTAWVLNWTCRTSTAAPRSPPLRLPMGWPNVSPISWGFRGGGGRTEVLEPPRIHCGVGACASPLREPRGCSPPRQACNPLVSNGSCMITGPVVPIGNHRKDVPSVRFGGRDDAHLQDVDLRPDKGRTLQGGDPAAEGDLFPFRACCSFLRFFRGGAQTTKTGSDCFLRMGQPDSRGRTL